MGNPVGDPIQPGDVVVSRDYIHVIGVASPCGVPGLWWVTVPGTGRTYRCAHPRHPTPEELAAYQLGQVGCG